MSSWRHILDLFVSWGPYGLLLLALLDSMGLPVVGGVDALLVAIAVNTPQLAYPAAVCAIVGSLAGSLFLFSVARKGGEVLLQRHISGRTGKKMHDWFQRYGLVTVFVPAISFVPLPMKVPVFCSGALRVRWIYFAAVVLIARIIRYFALAYLGRVYGTDTLRYLRQHALALALSALGLALVVAVGLRLYQRHRANLGEPE